jgi:[acyl-carrier-protein] S-malonyltransferase
VSLAFLYPGQGSQQIGMGAELLRSEPQLEHYLAQAQATTGLPIRRYCLEGPMIDLTRTEVAQPALLAVSLALTDAARARGLSPGFAAGHSLGEYTAAVVAGAMSVEDGLELVCLRGRLMSEVQSEHPGAMAAIIGLPRERVEEIRDGAAAAGSLALANVNAPSQIVLSGEEQAIARAIELAEEAGAQRVVRIQVGAAFHSGLMEPVATRMSQAADEIHWRDPQIPIALNATGRIVRTADEVRDGLVAEITSPVRWVECVQALLEAGAGTFLELGPGRVLAGFVRQIEPGADVFSADSPARLDDFAATHPAAARA